MSNALLSVTVLLTVTLHFGSACFLRTCLTKRSDPDFIYPTRSCMSCMGGKGQCVGANICCSREKGCIFGGEVASRCAIENLLPPCVVDGQVCDSQPNGHCVSDGVCCSDNACSFDSSCKRHGEAVSQ